MKHKLLLLFAMTLGLASNVWAELGTTTIGDKTYYQIGTAQDLLDFATLVNGGTTGANAVLTTNIDLSEVLSETVKWTPIGNSTNKYAGTFDGQGYSITGLSYSSINVAGAHGLFGNISNATVKNFSISGTLTLTNQNTSKTNYYNGTIGAAEGNNVTISGIRSELHIIVTNCKAHTGGILGSTVGNSNPVCVENCEYSGKIDHSGDGDCQAGILGYTYNGGVKNCIFSGIISGTSSKYGGILGYCKIKDFIGVQNCLSIGKIVANTNNTTAAAIIANYNGDVTSNVNNNYYCMKEGSSTNVVAIGNNASSCEAPDSVTDERLASGEICYALNGTQGGSNWYQNLSDPIDTIPTLNNSHKKIYHHKGLYFNDGDVVNLEIANADDLINFANIVNAGAFNVNGTLTDDIPLTSWPEPIGNWVDNACYKGHFNGRGFTIGDDDFSYTTARNYHGIFGVLSEGAIVENFKVRGTITNTSKDSFGVIGFTRDNSVTISNIHSYLTINNSGNDKKAGGILGNANNGTTNIDRCTFSGSISSTKKCHCGGIVGYVNNNATAIVNITNCLFAGTVTGVSNNDGSGIGGIIGYVGANPNKVVIKNCLSKGTVSGYTSGQFYGTVKNSANSIVNCYYQGTVINGTVNDSQTPTILEATSVTNEQLATGEICYLLNGDQSAIAWYQNIDKGVADTEPVLDSTHEQVYVNGYVCPNGYPQSGAIYSNTEGTTIQPHNNVDGFCSYCGTIQSDYMTPVDGYYGIGTPAQLKWFAAYVNAGHPAVNAKLTNITPIDLTDITIEPIGNASAAYTGTFDGQRSSITGLSVTSTGYGGFFGNINNATIKDFSIGGTLTATGGTGSGVVGWATSSTISGVHSALTISVPNDDVHHVGGVIGSARSNNTIKECSFTGLMTVTGSSTDNFAGVVAYIGTGCEVTNCANYGSVTFSDTGCNAGGIVGYNNSTSSIKNCLNTGLITCTGGTPTYSGAIVGKQKSTVDASKISNNYWLGTSSTKASGDKDLGTSAVEADATLLASGEVAYNLNSNPSDIKWYQTIGTDTYPTLSNTSEQVRFVGTAGYTTFYDEDNDWELLGDAKAYIGSINGSALHLDEIDDIPANTAVVISGTYYNRVSTTATADTDGNALLGSKGTIEGDGVNIYALAKKNDVVGFYRVADGVTIPAGKAYLNLSGSLVREFFTFVFDEDDATGINSALLTSPEEEGQVYNLAGQRISKLQKGINIINGKKVLK